MINIIDIHIHIGAPCDQESGCYWSKKFESGLAYLAMLVITGNLFKKVTLRRVVEHMLDVINDSEFVHRSVLLAMDEVYDETGCRRLDLTNLHVPNRLINSLAKENPRVLFGASIHPFRPRWEEELDYCLENKAVLCKWLPSAQMIDPSSSKCLPFYKRLAESGLPLLCHAGPEASIPPADDSFKKYNNPLYLRTAIETGVKVIFAHCATPLLPPPLENDQDYQDLLTLIREDEVAGGMHVYADLSALLLGTREQYVCRILRDINPKRLLFGSDYPIPVLGISKPKGSAIGHWVKYKMNGDYRKNPLDKSYSELAKVFPEDVFMNAMKVLRFRS
ncbi:MAG: amidohydrolase [Desulfobacterales bacterium]|nr:amidohydrolase [Desulfobacterales bacterium]